MPAALINPLESTITAFLRREADLHLLIARTCSDAIANAADAMAAVLKNGGKVIFVAFGDNRADARQLANELAARFANKSRPLPAIVLDPSIFGAVLTGRGADEIVATQLAALAEPGDLVVALSCNDAPRHQPIIQAAANAGVPLLAITGSNDGLLAEAADYAIIAPTAERVRLRECQIVLGNLLCELVGKQLPDVDEKPHGRIGVEQLLRCDGTGKVTDWESLVADRERWSRDSKTVVWTNGCFDLMHIGHVKSLQIARSYGDILVVGVNSDETIRHLKGPERPIIPASERVQVIAALECVDRVIVFQEMTPEQSLARLKPDVHCKGEDYAPPHGKPIPEASLVESYGGRVKFLPLYPSVSTSDLIKRVQGRAATPSTSL